MLQSANFRRFSALSLLIYLLAARGYAGSGDVTSQEYKTCIERAEGVNAEMLRCASNELQRQEARLNQALHAIEGSAHISVGRKDELESEQKAWVTERDKACMAVAQREANGGTLAPVIAADCAISKTAERADRLAAIAHGGGGAP